MSNEITPPPKKLPPSAKVPSEAPGVKEARIQWDAVENIVAMVLATIGLFYGKVPLEWWLGIIGSAIGLSSALRAYGAKRAGMISTVAFFVLQGAARHAGIVVLFLSLLLGGCAALPKIIRTIDVIARDLCEVWAVENEAKLGISPAAFCASAENVRPFVEAAKMAKAAAGTEAAAALKRDEVSP